MRWSRQVRPPWCLDEEQQLVYRSDDGERERIGRVASVRRQPRARESATIALREKRTECKMAANERLERSHSGQLYAKLQSIELSNKSTALLKPVRPNVFQQTFVDDEQSTSPSQVWQMHVAAVVAAVLRLCFYGEQG